MPVESSQYGRLPTPEPRPDVERTLVHDDPVIQEALLVVGQPLNPIEVVDGQRIRDLYMHEAGIRPTSGLDAFRAPGTAADPYIYVNRASVIYRSAARRSSTLARLKLAAVLVHEQVHNTDREFAACRLQADFFRSRLHLVPGRDLSAARHYLEGLEARARALARQVARWPRTPAG